MAEGNTTTTTTTAGQSTTTTTTAGQGSSNSGNGSTTTTTTVKKQGEVVVNKNARAKKTSDLSDAEIQAQNIENAKAEALTNHAAEHANDDDEGRSKPAVVAEDEEA